MRSGEIISSHLWKRFRTDKQRKLLRDELAQLRERLRTRSAPSWRWALRDIDFTIEPGESVALMGSNGSGKSTLLKLLTRVMYPYAGKVTTGGRVGALIEVEAGIHPDLTGRENVQLYGNLLGLTRRDVMARFDDIVSFAELNDAIDRQVKFYSSGMQMRLGFAVASFLEPDVLLVDEVLAVGDASFQQRCLDRMREVLNSGTTLVLVSHDLAAMEATCRRGMWLDRGVLRSQGQITDVLGEYRQFIEEAAPALIDAGGPVRLLKVEVGRDEAQTHASLEDLDITLVCEAHSRVAGRVHVGVTQGPPSPIFVCTRDVDLMEGITDVTLQVEHLPLPMGRFYVWASVTDTSGRDILPWSPVAQFSVAGARLDTAPPGVVRPVPVHVAHSWDIRAH